MPVSVIGKKTLAKTTHWKGGKEKRLTLWLLLVRSDGAYEVLRRHVNLSVSMLTDDLQGGEVAENLVWSRVGPYPVLILHHLPTRQEAKLMTQFHTLGINTTLIYLNINRIKEPAIFQSYVKQGKWCQGEWKEGVSRIKKEVVAAGKQDVSHACKGY